MSSPETQKRLWWEWTRSQGRPVYLWRCLLADGLSRGALFYLGVRGFDWLFPAFFHPRLFPGEWGAVFCLVFWALGGWVGGWFQWARFAEKYPPLSAPFQMPNHALQPTAGASGSPSKFHG